jgi:hypothetical protein
MEMSNMAAAVVAALLPWLFGSNWMRTIWVASTVVLLNIFVVPPEGSGWSSGAQGGAAQVPPQLKPEKGMWYWAQDVVMAWTLLW